MAECIKSGKNIGENDAHFSGFECRNKERATCPNYSYVFTDGTNCRLLRKKRNVRALLGLEENE